MTRPGHWVHPERWVRGACLIGLVALLTTAIGVLFPYALPVVFSMSVGQGLGALAFVCYMLAIVSEMLRHDAAKSDLAESSAKDDGR